MVGFVDQTKTKTSSLPSLPAATAVRTSRRHKNGALNDRSPSPRVLYTVNIVLCISTLVRLSWGLQTKLHEGLNDPFVLFVWVHADSLL